MATIQTLTFDFSGRDLSGIISSHKSFLSAPLDDLPLAEAHEGLEALVRAAGSKCFACRIPDDLGVVVIWQSFGTAAVVCTYWRRRLAQVDLLFADETSPSARDVLRGLSLSSAEIGLVEAAGRPLLVMGRVGETESGLSEIMGIIAYMPAWVEIRIAQ